MNYKPFLAPVSPILKKRMKKRGIAHAEYYKRDIHHRIIEVKLTEFNGILKVRNEGEKVCGFLKRKI